MDDVIMILKDNLEQLLIDGMSIKEDPTEEKIFRFKSRFRTIMLPIERRLINFHSIRRELDGLKKDSLEEHNKRVYLIIQMVKLLNNGTIALKIPSKTSIGRVIIFAILMCGVVSLFYDIFSLISYIVALNIVIPDLGRAYLILFLTGSFSILGIKFFKVKLLKLLYFLKTIYEDIIFEDSSCIIQNEKD